MTIPIPPYAGTHAQQVIAACERTLEITDRGDGVVLATVYPDTAGYAALGARMSNYGKDEQEALAFLGIALTLDSEDA